MAPRVVLTDRAWPDLAVEQGVFDAAGLELVTGPATAGNAAEIEALIQTNDPAAIMTCWAPVSAAAIRAAPKLRIIGRLGVGLDNIAVDEASARGAWVTNVPDYCVEEVSDHAVAMLLAHFRGVARMDRETKSLRWNPAGVRLARVRELTVGIVGFGRIGQATARKLAAFGCKIIVVESSRLAMPFGIEQVMLSGLQERADAIVLHVPLLDTTRGMIDDDFIAACRRRPFLVNVSRGGLVDNDALLRGLGSGMLSGAGLDVIEGEPSPPAGILSHPAVIATPHVAFLSDVSLIELRRRASEEVVRVLGGQDPLHACNRPVGAATPNPAGFDRGVASEIRVMEGPIGPIVVKRALPRLKVAAEWLSDPSRSLVEAAALETMAGIIGRDAVPKVLWTDPSRHEFAMELVPPRLRNWKQDLLTDRVDLRTAARAGQLLGQLHAGSGRRDEIRQHFADRRFFEELRIAPYFTRIADRNPDLAPQIDVIVRGMDMRRQALVHGDFSPKNILADGSDVVLLDCEVAHWGDPRFDVAFCMTHLTLKALRRNAGSAAALTAASLQLLDSYRQSGPAILDGDLIRILGCLMLARLEGDSPVDYLKDLDVPATKRIAVHLIVDPFARNEIGIPIPETSS
ncbi:NAD(P)-dependent oxidoreductase [Lichenicoccus sp.]|uniref:NAD(P)-dependent oxidoreductase n=1 Tax=Lichenicoccus sp. TaxID=2781899 RepID=UPI003D108557